MKLFSALALCLALFVTPVFAADATLDLGPNLWNSVGESVFMEMSFDVTADDSVFSWRMFVDYDDTKLEAVAVTIGGDAPDPTGWFTAENFNGGAGHELIFLAINTQIDEVWEGHFATVEFEILGAGKTTVVMGDGPNAWSGNEIGTVSWGDYDAGTWEYNDYDWDDDHFEELDSSDEISITGFLFKPNVVNTWGEVKALYGK